MNPEAGPAFIPFVLTQEPQTFINIKGVDWVARAAVEVLDKMKEAGVDKEEWLRQLTEASGVAGDDSELLKAISAYEAALDSALISDLENSNPWPMGQDSLDTM